MTHRATISIIVLSVVLATVVFLLNRSPSAPDHEEPMRLKIGFSPDWEYGSRKRLAHKLTNQAPAELEKVVRFFNEEFHPDLVIGGGDYIESTGVKPEKAKLQLREIDAIFKRLEARRLYALGNHDMRSLSKNEVMEILEVESPHGVTDIGEWRIVVFDTNFNKTDDSHRSREQYAEGYVSTRELRWLEAAITTERPTLVFSHHSPVTANNVDDVLARNITNEEAVRVVLERHQNVVAVISGHTPRPQHRVVNGVHYLIGDTLVNEEGFGAFAAISLEYFPLSRRTTVRFEHFGRRPVVYEIEKHLRPGPILE
jgi:alkaline phosphatase